MAKRIAGKGVSQAKPRPMSSSATAARLSSLSEPDLSTSSQSSGAPNRIMISYRVEDTGSRENNGDGTALKLKEDLEGLGYEIFVGEEYIQGSMGWMDEIAKAMKRANAIIFLCSNDYCNTIWTKKEVAYAMEKRMKVVPIWHSGVYPPEPVEFVMAGIQRVPLGRKNMLEVDPDVFLRQLVKALFIQGAKPALHLATTPGASDYIPSDADVNAEKRRLVQVSPKAVTTLAQKIDKSMLEVAVRGHAQLSELYNLVSGDSNFTEMGLKKLIARSDLMAWAVAEKSSTSARMRKLHLGVQCRLWRPTRLSVLGGDGGDVIYILPPKVVNEYISTSRHEILVTHAVKGTEEHVGRIMGGRLMREGLRKTGWTYIPYYRTWRRSSYREGVRSGSRPWLTARLSSPASLDGSPHPPDVMPLSFSMKARPGSGAIFRGALESGMLCKAATGDLGDVVFLIERGADVNEQLGGGRTPLHRAVEIGQVAIVEVLLKHGADPNLKNGWGRTPLHSAVENGQIASAEVLLKHGADPNPKNGDGWTPLHWAAFHGRTETAQLLLNNGADPNAKDMRSVTPLYCAARMGHTEVTQLLIAKGADPNVQDKVGQTPFDVAQKEGKNAVVQLLRGYNN